MDPSPDVATALTTAGVQIILKKGYNEKLLQILEEKYGKLPPIDPKKLVPLCFCVSLLYQAIYFKKFPFARNPFFFFSFVNLSCQVAK